MQLRLRGSAEAWPVLCDPVAKACKDTIFLAENDQGPKDDW